MAAVKVFAVAIFCTLLFTAVSCQEAQGDPEEGQGQGQTLLDYLITEKVPCNYTEIQGAVCLDCHKRLICTKVGGFVKPCWFPFRRNCVNGRCSSRPSEECASTTTEEPTTTEVPITTEGPTTTEVPITTAGPSTTEGTTTEALQTTTGAVE